MASSWQQVLGQIGRDRRSGATTLLAQALEAGRLFLLATRDLPPAPLLRALERLTRRLTTCQPSMAPFLTLANALWLGVEGRPRGMAPWEALHDALVQYADDLDRGMIETSKSAARLVRSGSVVLTYSNSTAVRLALWRAVAEGKRFEVACSESRPMREGVALAGALAERGVPVHLTVDAALFGWLGRATLVMVGADAVTAAGIVNKIGTRPLLEAARRCGVSAYVLADSTKWLPPRLARFWRVRDESPGEVATLRHPNLTVENRYFDMSPLSLAAGLVSAGGVSRPASIRERIRHGRVSAGLVQVLSASAPDGEARPRDFPP